MDLKEAAAILRQDEYNSWIKRFNWQFMDERIKSEFDKCKLDSSSENELGTLYLSRLKDDSDKYKNYQSTQYINATHVMTGARLLGTYVFDKDKDTFTMARERSAQLWYSQGPAGDVLVCVSPYQSDLDKIDENEIIIGRYQDPYQINELVIKKHFEIFFRYCTCTSLYSILRFKPYLYRQYLVLNDLRLRTKFLKKIIRIGERVAIVFLAAAAILVSLYIAGKFPFI
ncbi:hypothetical protein WCT79_07445 [Pectobacterium carotovorum]|uniref:hypothetical protein n=1 Tax=Pectobacterium carotovorum TaxID=554 RepID=UPI00301A568D